MLVRLRKRLTLEEVERQLEELERASNMRFDEFEERLLTSEKVDEKSVETYFRWAKMVHAYRGYMEGGELHCLVRLSKY